MIRAFITCCFILAYVILPAQSLPSDLSATKSSVVRAQSWPLEAYNGTGIDTLSQYVDRATGFSIFDAEYGYVFGMARSQNVRITDVTALQFDDFGSLEIQSVWVWMGRKEIVDNPDNIFVELYDMGPDSLPSTLLARGVMNMAFVDTTSVVNLSNFNGLTPFAFSMGAPEAQGPFLIGINYEESNDTIAIVSTNSGDGQGERRAVQRFSKDLGSYWQHADEIWDDLDADPVIIPIVAPLATAVDQSMGNENFRVMPAYPNPSGDMNHIEVWIHEAGPLQLQVWDASGRVLRSMVHDLLPAGEHRFDIDLGDLRSGMYYFTVTTAAGRLSSSFTVAR